MDVSNRILFCACDGGIVFGLNADTGEILLQAPLSGVPDVVFHNPSRRHLYAAVGDPGVIDVFDAPTLKRLETVPTEKGVHTLGFDARHNKVYAFLPDTHRAAIFIDKEELENVFFRFNVQSQTH